MNEVEWKTRNQINNEAIKYNPSVSKCLELDQDYCIRGYIYDKEVNMYTWCNI